MVGITKFLAASLLATSALAYPHTNAHNHAAAHNHVAKRGSSTKKGAAYNDAGTVQSLGSVNWAYNWNMLADGSLPSGVDFVPMLWGSKMFGDWFNAIQTVLFSGCNYIMGFNEPDSSSQANMSPSDAVASYKKYISPYNGKAKLISPAVTNAQGDNAGLGWLRQFLDGCGNDCGLTGLAVHWYGDSADDFQNFVTQATELAGQYNLSETWVTEFALNSDMNGSGGSQQSADFLNQVVPWLEGQNGVTRYAYFMCADGYLLSGNGLSVSGQAYMG